MKKVGLPGTRIYEVGDGLTISQLGLEVLLEAGHLTGTNVVLRCTALVGILYRKSTQLSLGPRTTEPVPERVTSSSGSNSSSTSYLLLLLLVVFAWR